MRGPVDAFSQLVAGILRPIYETIATFMVVTGIGAPVGMSALASDGRMPWIAVGILTVPCLILAWLSERIRRKYLRWVRIAADESD
jgi:hypothetical protein